MMSIDDRNQFEEDDSFTDPAAEAPEGLSGALADVTVAGNHGNLRITIRILVMGTFMRMIVSGDVVGLYD